MAIKMQGEGGGVEHSGFMGGEGGKLWAKVKLQHSQYF